MWALKTAMRLPKSVQVEWEDGLMASFNYVWLRDNSTRRPCLVHLDLNTKPEKVDCSRNELNVTWPPFMTSNYSSDFLRENVMHCQMYQTPNVSGNSSSIPEALDRPSPLRGQLCTVVNAGPVDSEQVMGTVFWTASAQEPGTVWPHMNRVPTLVAVDNLHNRASELFIVDTAKALATLAQRYPQEFEFLEQCTLEYSEGTFRSRHKMCHIHNGRIFPGIFNNAARSSTITVEPGSVERLYECLQKFGRTSSEWTYTVQLEPGKRLLVDNTKAMLGAPAQQGRQLLLRCLV